MVTYLSNLVFPTLDQNLATSIAIGVADSRSSFELKNGQFRQFNWGVPCPVPYLTHILWGCLEGRPIPLECL